MKASSLSVFFIIFLTVAALSEVRCNTSPIEYPKLEKVFVRKDPISPTTALVVSQKPCASFLLVGLIARHPQFNPFSFCSVSILPKLVNILRNESESLHLFCISFSMEFNLEISDCNCLSILSIYVEFACLDFDNSNSLVNCCTFVI